MQTQTTATTAPDAFALRQALAADYAHARLTGGFVSLQRARSMRNRTVRLARLTGLTTDEVVATARADAEHIDAA